MDRISSIVNEVVCGRFGVTEGELYGVRTSAMANAARGYAWLLLHEQYGWSGRRLSVEYGRRERGVWKQVSKYRYLCRVQAGYGALYSELSSEVEGLLSSEEKC